MNDGSGLYHRGWRHELLICLNMYNMVDKEKQENEKGIILQALCRETHGPRYPCGP